MLEQIHAPSEDGRKVQMMVSLATTLFGLSTIVNAGAVIAPAAALGLTVALAGVAGVVRNAHRAARLA